MRDKVSEQLRLAALRQFPRRTAEEILSKPKQPELKRNNTKWNNIWNYIKDILASRAASHMGMDYGDINKKVQSGEYHPYSNQASALKLGPTIDAAERIGLTAAAGVGSALRNRRAIQDKIHKNLIQSMLDIEAKNRENRRMPVEPRNMNREQRMDWEDMVRTKRPRYHNPNLYPLGAEGGGASTMEDARLQWEDVRQQLPPEFR